MSNFDVYLAEAIRTPFGSFLLDAFSKATVLFLLAIVATALLRKSSAAVRHRIWCLTFAALVLLPGLSAAVPAWRLAVLPQGRQHVGKEIGGASKRPREVSIVAARRRGRGAPAAQNSLPLAEREDYGTPDRVATQPIPPAIAQPAGAQLAVRPSLFLPTMWLAGALVALSPLLAGLIRTRRLRRRARPINDAVWLGLLGELCRRLALGRRVALYETEAALMPMTWGVVRPVVVLPRQARDWSDRLRRIVLLHELAHVKRGDVGFQISGRAACALYWLHPLAWYALRRLRVERELACDDCVVRAGERATDYAAELLSIARRCHSLPFAAAVAMAQPSHLEHRLRAMFDLRCSHLPVSNPAARMMVAGAAILATATAAVRLAPRTAVGDENEANRSAVASSEHDDDLITVRGQVVDPRGKPIAGADVFAARWYWDPHLKRAPLARTKSNDSGRFTISFRKSQYDADVQQPEQWRNTTIVATGAGFGSRSIVWRDLSADQEPTLRLVADDVPITGRVVDLEGRPVASARVRALRIDAAKDDNLDAWLAALARGEPPETAFREMQDMLQTFDGWTPHSTTDKEGRFTLHGIGRERVAHLEITCTEMAYSTPIVVTRPMQPVHRTLHSRKNATEIVYGADFQLAASPTQPIVGVIRDAQTRQPLPGVAVEATQFADGVYAERAPRTVTDEAGRYRLTGMPKGKGNELLIVPNDDQPYFMREAKVPESTGLEPISLDIDLERGIWITGRITDHATQKPVIARVYYLPFISNEFAQKSPAFGSSLRVDGFQGRYASRPDGSYRLVGLPGRAIVGVESVVRPYRLGAGAEAIAGLNNRGTFETYDNPRRPGKKWPNTMKEINPPAGIESVTCDLALDPGETMTLSVLDPDGKPLSGFDVRGRTADFEPWQPPSEQPKVDVVNLNPDQSRTLVIRHERRKLGKVVRLRLADYPSHSTTVTTAPLGTIVGRLVDGNGDPISGAVVYASVHQSEASGDLPPVTSDEQGRFRYADLATGGGYDLTCQSKATGILTATLADDVAFAPGETKDLGDVTITGN